MLAIQEQIRSSDKNPLEKHLIKGCEDKSVWKNSLKLHSKIEFCTTR